MMVENSAPSAETVSETPVNEVGSKVDAEGNTTPTPKTYTKEQVQDLMRKRVARSHNSFFTRYGVKDLKGLDDLFEKSNKFQQMQDEYGAIQLKNSDLVRENAFLRNDIEPTKYDDIIAHFKGLNVDFSEDALLEAIKTHPEWLKQRIVEQPKTTIQSMGLESHNNPTVDEKELAFKLLGVK